VVVVRLIVILALTGFWALAQPAPVIIDTDAGSDDFLAIAFLLAHPNVPIEAITVANGMAHVDAGARNVIRLLDVAGRREIPVFAGRGAPLRGAAEFPADWRKASDDLPGVELPAASRRQEPRPAASYLLERLRRGPPARILALGPLTNLAEAFLRDPSIAANIQEIVSMGGAIHVPGNNLNKTAEWNIFIDPYAARIVFRSGVRIRLIPLDATNKVPIGAEFLREFQSAARSPVGKIAAQVLATDRSMIDQSEFYAWDPLAAVALLYPAVVKTNPLRIDVRQDPPEQGRTVQLAGKPNAEVALDADAATFHKLFLDVFRK